MSLIRFPTTTAEFIACQERLIHGTLSEGMKEPLPTFVEAFNTIYAEALEGETATLKIALQTAEGMILRYPSDKAVVPFMRAVKAWCMAAYGQGLEMSRG